MFVRTYLIQKIIELKSPNEENISMSQPQHTQNPPHMLCNMFHYNIGGIPSIGLWYMTNLRGVQFGSLMETALSSSAGVVMS